MEIHSFLFSKKETQTKIYNTIPYIGGFMKKFLLTLMPLFFFSSLIASNDIYDTVNELPFDPAGYFATEFPLDKILKEREVRTVIELGCWAGASTRFFGHRVGEKGKVYAIDHWHGTPQHRGELSDERLDHIFQVFLSNVCHVELKDRIVPIRMSTEEAARCLNIAADLIYIDAGRDAKTVYRDVINWTPHLNPDGVMCGAEWREPGVRQGVQKAALELGKQIEHDRRGYFWVLK